MIASEVVYAKPAPIVQDYSSYEVYVKQFEEHQLVEKIGAGGLGEWRQWTFKLLALFKALPSAPRPQGLVASIGSDPDAEIDRLWAKVVADPAGPSESATSLSDAAMSAIFEALAVSPEGVLSQLPRFMAMPGVDRRSQLWITAKAADAAWTLQRRSECKEWLDEYDRALGSDDLPSGRWLDEAEYFVHVLRGLAAIRDGRPDLAFEPLRTAQEAANRFRLAGGSIDVWGDAIIKRLDLAHASDDVKGGRAIGEEAAADEAWNLLEGRASELGIRWRLDALDLIDPSLTDDEIGSALDSIEETVRTEFEASRFWASDRRLAARHHVRASARLGEFARAREMRTAMESMGLVDPREAEVLDARIRYAEEGPSHELATLLRAAARDRIKEWKSSPAKERNRGLLHFDSDAELVSLALQSVARAGGGAGDALELLAEVQTAGSLASTLGAVPPTHDALAELAPVGGGCLVFAPGFETDLLFLVDRDSTQFVELKNATSLQHERRALQRAFRNALDGGGDSERAEFDRLALQLSTRLFSNESRAQLASWERVWIIGTDAWGEIAFELLPLDGRRMGSTMEIAYVPSIPIAAKLIEQRAPAADRSQRPILLAVATDPGDEARLSYPGASSLGAGSTTEAALLPGALRAATRSLLDQEATLATWSAALETLPWLTVVVGHGVRARDRQRGVLLYGGGAEGGVLTPQEALKLRAPEIVVLASCEAGRSAYLRGGDGADGLEGALLTAGARVVVSADVPLQLRTAVGQTRAILDSCALEGRSVARALMDGRLAAPNDLARWVVRATGDGHNREWVPALAENERPSPVLQPKTSRYAAIIAAGLFAALLASIFVGVKRRSSSA